MLQVADPAGRNHRHRHRIGDGAGQGNIKAVLGAIPVHAGQQDFTRTVIGHLPGPGHRIQPGGLAATMGEDFPAIGLALGTDLLGIDGHHDALGPETLRRLADKFRIVHCRRIDTHLVGTGIEQITDIFQSPYAAAHGEGNKHLAGDLLHRVQGGVTLLVTGGDIQKGNLVSAGVVIALGNLHRVTGVADIHKLDTLDHPTGIHIETRNNAFG